MEVTGHQSRPGRVSVVIPTMHAADPRSLVDDLLTQQRSPVHELDEILLCVNSDRDMALAGPYTSPLISSIRALPVGSSYSARNAGWTRAKSELVLFLDDDCRLSPGYLEGAVGCLVNGGFDAVAGQVRMPLGDDASAAEVWDSYKHLRNELLVPNGVAVTANLLVRRQLWEDVGLFPESRVSGADLEWTQLLTTRGYRLGYCADAWVAHPPRKLRALLKKRVRIGRGQAQAGKSAGELLRTSSPPWPSTIREAIRKASLQLTLSRFAAVLLVAWASVIATNLGRISCILRSRSIRNHRPGSRPA